MFIEVVDWLTGRRARREEREAYLKALEVIAKASEANANNIKAYFDMVKASYDSASAMSKGWTNTDHKQAIDELFESKPDLKARLPKEIEGDYMAIEAWLGEEIEKI
jgi:hypothetical protein